MHSLAGRMKRAVQLESALYEEVEHDKGSMSQALLVVALSSVAAGLGLMPAGAGPAAFFWWTVASLLGWLFWAWIITLVGTFLLPERGTSSDLGEMLRVLGFASAPGLMRIFGVFSPLREFVFVIASLWMLVATVVAVRQALDFKSTGRAILVCVAGWLIQLAMIFLVAWLTGANQPVVVISGPASVSAGSSAVAVPAV